MSGLPSASARGDVSESYTSAVVWFGALGIVDVSFVVHMLVEFRIGDGVLWYEIFPHEAPIAPENAATSEFHAVIASFTYGHYDPTFVPALGLRILNSNWCSDGDGP